MSHDFKTGMTTALYIGFASDLHGAIDSSSQLPSALASVISKFEKYRSLWTHPLFLPSLFLAEHTRRVGNLVSRTLDRQVVLLEYRIGVTKAGRADKPHLDFPDDSDVAELPKQKLYVGEQLQRANVRKLMEDLNDLTTRLEFTKGSPNWDDRFAVFILRMLDRSQRLENYRGTSSAAFRETLEYVQNCSQSLCEIVHGHYSRMQLQLNIVGL